MLGRGRSVSIAAVVLYVTIVVIRRICHSEQLRRPSLQEAINRGVYLSNMLYIHTAFFNMGIPTDIASAKGAALRDSR